MGRIVGFLLCVMWLWLPISSHAQYLSQPESVVYDVPRDRHLVSNYSNGQIIEINKNGIQDIFAPGKSSSAGLHIVGNTVYVGCGSEGVLGYDLQTGLPVMDVTIPGSVLLNDIASDTSGNLYVSDPFGNKIYRIRISDHSYTTLVDYIYWPNGLLFDAQHNRLLVCTSIERDILAVDLEDGSLTLLVHVGIAHLDGLAEDNAGNIYISTQGSNEIYRYDPDLSGPPELVSSGHIAPADIYFNKRKHLLCVPNIGGTTVDFVPIDVPQWMKITDGDVVNDGGSTQGVSWADYDDNGYPDLFFTNMIYPGGQNNRLYQNNTDHSFTRIITGPIVTNGGASRTSTWGDCDNDGDLDCFVANLLGTPNFLYLGEGDGTFTRVTSGEIATEVKTSSSASWGDYDQDGLLDLFVSNYGTNSLFHNDGGSFTKILTGDIATDDAETYGAIWGDYDNDSYLDLFVSNPTGNNSLYRNNGDGTFAKITGQNIVTDGGESFGGSWGDYDNDGDLDLFVPNISSSSTGDNFLYTNNGDGTFTRVTEGEIVNDGGYSFGSSWGDYDNDGDLDLFVANYPFGGVNTDFLYENNGNGTFTKITDDAVTTDIGGSYGTAWGDYDRDGDLDLAIARMLDDNEDNVLYRNNGNGNNWINIRCIGTTSNRSAIGTKIRIKTRVGIIPVYQMREISGQTGFCGQNNLNVHFGLNIAGDIDSLIVEWPSGLVEVGADVGVNGYLTIIEGQMDPDGDGIIGNFDNCPDDANSDQADDDGDRIGEVCDECPGDWINDPDEDGFCGFADNCPYTYNPSQQDDDGDQLGTPCDNCPDSYNPGQEDINGNGIGDSCEVPESWLVRADGSGEAPTIQAAIDSCTHGDTIVVADGVYTGDGNRELHFSGRRRIVLRSENGPQWSIIDCAADVSMPRRAMTFDDDGDSTIVVDGLTIRGGYGPLFSGSNSGGGMLFDNASPTIKNCVFTDNTATMGGGVMIYQASPRFSNCTFVENSADYGSAITLYSQATATVENCLAAFNLGGPPVYCVELSTATMSCCDVYGNAGGDWTDCITGQEGSNGNISADPRFCDPDANEFGLLLTSPCAPANNDCEDLIGALDVACYCECGFPGDMDCNGMSNPVDVVYLVNFVYKSLNALCPPAGCPYPIGDVDCSGLVNPVDVVYLVNAVYKSQNALCDGCNP